MKKIEITCIGCSKKHEIVSEDGHTGIVKCDCGATTTVKGDAGAAGAIFEQIAVLMEKAPALMKEFKAAKRKGFESGIDDGLHEVAKAMVIEIVKEDAGLRSSLKEFVQNCLERSLHPENEEPEVEGPAPRG